MPGPANGVDSNAIAWRFCRWLGQLLGIPPTAWMATARAVDAAGRSRSAPSRAGSSTRCAAARRGGSPCSPLEERVSPLPFCLSQLAPGSSYPNCQLFTPDTTPSIMENHMSKVYCQCMTLLNPPSVLALVGRFYKPAFSSSVLVL